MSNNHLRRIFSILFLLITFAAKSQQVKGFAGIRIYHENDFIIPFATNYDDNYTGGLKVELITNLLPAENSFLLNPLKGKFYSLAFQFGVTAFTPRDLADPNLITTDRPYASFRHWGIGVSSVSRDTSWKLTYEIQLGAMGRPSAGDAQSYIHRHHWFWSDRPDPQGWDHQVAFDGAMAINLHSIVERKIWSSKLIGANKNFRWIELTGRADINLGQYMINTALEPRINLININHRFGEHEDEPGLPAISGHGKKAFRFGFHVFAGARPRFVLHNATLTGKLIGKKSEYTVPSSAMKNVLLEYDLGLMLRLGGFRFGYNVFSRSKEFDYQNTDRHSWGGVHVGYLRNIK